MKRTLLSITLDEETDELTTQIECFSMEDLNALADTLAQAFSRHDTFKRLIIINMMKHSLLQYQEDNAVQEEEIQFPDFDKIVKEAKIVKPKRKRKKKE